MLGIGALAGMLVAGVVLGAGAAGQRLYFFVPAARPDFPDWMRGPLADLGLRLDPHDGTALLVVLFACYLLVLACATRIPAWLAIAVIVALHGVFLLAPPLFSADVFGYINFARLGAIHGLDPYTNGAASAPGDASAQFVRWKDIASPYGPLFTLASYPLAHLSVAVPRRRPARAGRADATDPRSLYDWLALALLWLLWRAWRGANWVMCAGWATLAALLASAWLTPWYVVWLLSLAAIAPSGRLRLASLAFCAYVVATRVVYYLV